MSEIILPWNFFCDAIFFMRLTKYIKMMLPNLTEKNRKYRQLCFLQSPGDQPQNFVI